ncbi:hypothetical protein LWI28_026300 [Acer negundo]|uniref:Retrovirus-related Pol polyprotein from transposon TNT 1-94 n=1 Tax=Acer negundo TaxID=4023 RepID=A0AAD5JB59_ACENE|nr:hypothetical protein LWI28_026300 [Acer negundo]
MVGDVDTHKFTSGILITFAGGVVAWQSRLQKCVALSTTEVEFIVATEVCKELLWMKRHYRRRSLKLVVRLLGWRIPPHSRKLGDLLGWVGFPPNVEMAQREFTVLLCSQTNKRCLDCSV